MDSEPFCGEPLSAYLFGKLVEDPVDFNGELFLNKSTF